MCFFFEGQACFSSHRAVYSSRVYLDSTYHLHAQRKKLCVSQFLQRASKPSRPPSVQPAIGNHAPSRGVLYFNDDYYRFRNHCQWPASPLWLPCIHAAPRAPQHKDQFVQQLFQSSCAACHQPRDAPSFLLLVCLDAPHTGIVQTENNPQTVLCGRQWWLVNPFVHSFPFSLFKENIVD